jgi:PhnB protein
VYRSMMQVFVKGSKDALEFYQKAFNAEVLCAYEDGNGGYIHAELNAYGQIIAVSEIAEDVTTGNTMMFCLHFGDGGEEHVKTAYDVLKEGAITCSPLTDSCGYSPLQFVCTDKYGVTWCIFI